MKRIKIYLLLISFITAGVFFSCEKVANEQVLQDDVQISFGFQQSKLKSVDLESNNTPESVSIVLINEQGGTLYSERLPLYELNGGYISHPISIKQGSYLLSEFLVLDNNGNVIYLTPISGSKYDYLVENPLPLAISANFGESNQVVPEVIAPDGATAEDFGYFTMKFNVLQTFDFVVTAFAYDEIQDNFEPTVANISVLGDGEEIFSGELEAAQNSVRLNDGYENYKVIVGKDGYSEYSGTYTSDSLKQFLENPIEIVLWEDDVVSTVVKPDYDMMVHEAKPDSVLSTQPYLIACSWTFYAWGVSGYKSTRAYLNFDLSLIPENATIYGAKMYLFHTEVESEYHYGINECWMERVVSSWNESSLTWNNQPGSSEVNRVEIPASGNETQDYIVDVTQLVKDMINNPGESFGFVLKQKTEDDNYRKMSFSSIDSPNEALHPKLEIFYRH